VRGALMVCGTASDAGKSHVVTGLCRLLARRGVRVAPFKAQNMSLNSWVTAAGHEIGRAQGIQAVAAGTEPDVLMNPILLKPTGERDCQVVVRGRPIGVFDAQEYHDHKPELLSTVLDALAQLRHDYDVVILEGAGSPAEINLLDRDIVNLSIADAIDAPAIVVGDIDRGGVFAALHGTVSLLPPQLRARVRGFVINKLRGDPALLLDGTAELERRSGVPTLGVLPFIDDVALDAEDSLALAGRRPRPSSEAVADHLDIAAVCFPRLANFTDLDPLAIEPGISLRWVTHASGLGDPDLIVLPGTKSTVTDLAWLRECGLDGAIERSTALVLGICGGYQMLGHRIVDLDGVESAQHTVVDGLGLLDVTTSFARDKTVRRHDDGYEIHHGVVTRGASSAEWKGGATDGRIFGTNLHGLFEPDEFRAAFLIDVGQRRQKTFVPAGISFAAARCAQLDRLADLLEDHLDIAAIETLIKEGAP
jgi:adenosylcobyric acid synthase